MTSALVGAAFDLEAPGYDASFGRDASGLLFRHVFQERLRALFRPGDRVLDLGCGTGEDALFMASAGVRVDAIDISRVMVERACVKAEALGVPAELVRFECAAVESLEQVGGEAAFDGAYSNFGALNCADLAAVGRGLGRRLRPGASVLFSLMGRLPFVAVARRALTGQGEVRGRGPVSVAGLLVPVRYPSSSAVRRELGRDFEWRGGFALGLVVPRPGHSDWAARNPQTFGVLAALERVLRRWPLLRALGDHMVLEGARR